MFRHIGKKVKLLAQIIFWLGILGSLGAGVYLYLTKVFELLYCILIGVGGCVVFWLCSWVLYAIGDTHVKLERLEDKLIPKPAYMNYLSENNPKRGQCEICGKTTDLVDAKIVDQLGTRYRKVCRECFASNKCLPAE